jgi:hypothetical protein
MQRLGEEGNGGVVQPGCTIKLISIAATFSLLHPGRTVFSKADARLRFLEGGSLRCIDFLEPGDGHNTLIKGSGKRVPSLCELSEKRVEKRPDCSYSGWGSPAAATRPAYARTN